MVKRTSVFDVLAKRLKKETPAVKPVEKEAKFSDEFENNFLKVAKDLGCDSDECARILNELLY